MCFENVFTDWLLGRELSLALLKYAFSEEECGNKVFILERRLDGLRDAGRICNRTLLNAFEKLGFKELNVTPLVFVKQGMIIICYGDDLIMCSEFSSDIDSLKALLNSKLCIKYLAIPSRFPVIELDWRTTQHVT